MISLAEEETRERESHPLSIRLKTLFSLALLVDAIHKNRHEISSCRNRMWFEMRGEFRI